MPSLFILFSILWLTLVGGGYIIVNVNNKSPTKVREEKGDTYDERKPHTGNSSARDGTGNHKWRC